MPAECEQLAAECCRMLPNANSSKSEGKKFQLEGEKLIQEEKQPNASRMQGAPSQMLAECEQLPNQRHPATMQLIQPLAIRGSEPLVSMDRVDSGVPDLFCPWSRKYLQCKYASSDSPNVH